MKKESTKEAILNAIDNPKANTVTDICHLIGICRTTFYFHYNKDLKFQKKLLEKQKEKLERAIAKFN